MLLADEHAGNLGEVTGGEIVTLLESLWHERGLTLVIVTHDPRLACRARLAGARKGRAAHDPAQAGQGLRLRCRGRPGLRAGLGARAAFALVITGGHAAVDQ